LSTQVRSPSSVIRGPPIRSSARDV
jgi:hypothetical protein